MLAACRWWQHLEGCKSKLEAFGAPLGSRGLSWGHLGSILGVLEAILGPTWKSSEPSWAESTGTQTKNRTHKQKTSSRKPIWKVFGAILSQVGRQNLENYVSCVDVARCVQATPGQAAGKSLNKLFCALTSRVLGPGLLLPTPASRRLLAGDLPASPLWGLGKTDVFGQSGTTPMGFSMFSKSWPRAAPKETKSLCNPADWRIGLAYRHSRDSNTLS